ncbi:MAG: M3 family metallopeptidase [Trueperaceae bacterium]
MRKFHLDPNIPTTSTELESIITTLRNLTMQKVDESWFFALSDLQCRFNDAWFNALWHKNQDTASVQATGWYKTIVEEFVPQFEEVFSSLNTLAQQAKKTSGRLERIRRRMNSATTNSREEIELSTKISLLSNEFQTLASQQVIDFEGPLNVMAASVLLGKESSSDRRKDIWLKIQERKQIDAAKSQDLMLKLLDLRRQIATASGLKDYREYCWKKKERDSYTPDDALTMLSSVESIFADSYKTLANIQMDYLEVNSYMPWDTVALIAAPELERKLTEEDYIGLVERAFASSDREFGEVVRGMVGRGHFDLLSRNNKSSYNFCGTFYTVNEPAVSCNLSGDLIQLNTAFHEFGHAVHHSFMNEGTLYFEKGAPYEISEFAATAFQLLGYGVLEEIGFTTKEALRFRFGMLVNKLNLVREITSLDRLQHWLYSQDKTLTIPDINAKFLELTSGQPEDWSGHEHFKPLGWHHAHVISEPFYTVEYVISWIGALIFYETYVLDKGRALTALKAAMRLGYSRDTIAIFEVLGIQFPFGESEIVRAKNGLDRLIGTL